jgi:hypothetical protein
MDVAVLEEAREAPSLEDAPRPVDELAGAFERSLRHARESKVRPVNRKLVVFVPREALDSVREALFEAGAGRIGDYERCSWYTEGTGTFFGREGTEPSVGQAGREQRVAELRLETVFPEERQTEIVDALRRAHPYEEPAFDIYPLA